MNTFGRHVYSLPVTCGAGSEARRIDPMYNSHRAPMKGVKIRDGYASPRAVIPIPSRPGDIYSITISMLRSVHFRQPAKIGKSVRRQRHHGGSSQVAGTHPLARCGRLL